MKEKTVNNLEKLDNLKEGDVVYCDEKINLVKGKHILEEDLGLKDFIKKLSMKKILKAKTKADKINARFEIADNLLRYFYPDPNSIIKKWQLSPLTKLKGLLITIGFLDMIKDCPLSTSEMLVMFVDGSNEKHVKKYNKAQNVQLYILKYIEKIVKSLKEDT